MDTDISFCGGYFGGDQTAGHLYVPCLRRRPAASAALLWLRLSGCCTGSAGSIPRSSRSGQQYTIALLLFSAITLLVTYAIERLQHVLPLNPQQFGPVPADLAFNTAASFTTNTNWQAYSGESTMSYLTQMAGLAWHNFISAAVGIGDRYRLGSRIDVPLTAGDAQDDRQLLGRSHPRDGVRAAADLHSGGVGPGLARSDSELFLLCGPHHSGRRQANSGHGSGRFTRSHQGTRHQWRWLLQRQ